MPCAKPASKRSRAFAFSLVAAMLALGAAGAGAAAAPEARRGVLPPPPLPDAEHYSRCLQQANSNPQKAYDDAEAWYAIGGGFPAQHCAAVALVGLKKYAEAATQLEGLANAMLQQGPDMRADALEQAGQAWLLANQPNQAKTAFDAALAFKPKDAELLIDRAEAFALGGKLFDAIDDLNTVLEQDPKRIDALVYRASAYRQLGSLDLALDDVERALRLDPNSVAGLLERGNIRRLKNDDAGARADWQRVAQMAPGSPAATSAEDNLAHLAEQPSPAGNLLTGPATAKKP
ncbi:MAG TPA: tetratricopeptide repeat protein [Stellaceae bacterium]|nr:tetratricopeptide repeat protein [Stellaceae bacterium]